jgi:glycosyltransferase involved in cell wall biosynthesis
MMCGVCVVASDSGGPLEIIDDGINGLLFKTFDGDDLAKKLALLYHDTVFRQTIADAGRVKALEMFEGEKQFAELQKVFTQRALLCN